MRGFFSNRWVQIACAVLVLYGAYFGFRLWKGRNDGFAIEKIASSFPNDPKWEVVQTPEVVHQVNEIIKQPFVYLGHGFQFYAFESADGKYVLKFLRHQRLRAPVLYDMLPNLPLIRNLKEKKAESRKKRVDYLFDSLKVAFEDVPQETGMIALHLNKTKNLYREVTLIDMLDDQYRVSLDDTEFVLQQKATLVKPTIRALMEGGQLKEAKLRINQIFQLLSDCAKKGILDNDGALIKKNNLGFLQDRAIYIDAGKLTRRENMKTLDRFQHDLRRLRPLRKWLVTHYPPLAAHFDKEQKRVLENFLK